MEPLIEAGSLVATFAIECTVTISLAALAALLAARILGRRQPGVSFAFIVAAFLLGTLLLFEQGRPSPNLLAADPSSPVRLHVARPSPTSEVPTATVVPGLTARYGSLFQVRFSGPSVKEEPSAAVPGAPTGSIDGWGLLGLLWLLGVIALAVHHLVGLCSIRATLEAAHPCEDRRLLHAAACVRDAIGTGPVGLRLSSASRSAFLAGITRPCIVLPEEAIAWADDRLTSTLIHEHMHVRRCDILVAEALRVIVSLAWCSPLPWLAFSRALKLREEACDQAVLRSGTRPADYAANLLAAARSLSSGLRAATASISSGSDLEQRIRSILETPHPLPARDRFLRRASAAIVLAAVVGTTPLTTPLYAFLESASSAKRLNGIMVWPAILESPFPAGTAPVHGTFSLTGKGGYTRIQLNLAGRTSVHRLPSVALPSALPLSGRARMILPFGGLVDAHSAHPFTHPAWTIWDDRAEPVTASAPGTVAVVRMDPREGTTIEVDHGSQVRTCYGLGRQGRSLVEAGEFVATGTPLGTFGSVSPNDIPSLSFSIRVHAHGAWVALDPAPFLFAAPDPRATPLAASVVNASVRIGDRAEVRRLLAAGLSPNQVSGDGTLPLEWVLLNRDLAMAKDLLEAGADPNAPTWNIHQAHIALHGPTVAQLARETGDPELMALLVPEQGSRP